MTKHCIGNNLYVKLLKIKVELFMKSEVTMQREIFGLPVAQKSKSELLSATDLERAGNRYRILDGKTPFDLKNYLNTKGTKEFIAELEANFGKVLISGRTKGGHVWVHPLLFVDIALTISPKLKVEVYKWLSDNLIKFRNDSGDSFNKLRGLMWERCTNKSTFKDLITGVAVRIKKAVKVNDWQDATEEQLKQRDDIHNQAYAVLSITKDIDTAVTVAINNVIGE